MPVSAGDRFGPYEVLAPIGAGAMGEVWKVRDTPRWELLTRRMNLPDACS